ncbi:protein PRQFV-amide-like [Mercenaria mercenaria]|uniref:protein PRQFV-amide-like n=1 Tax=Mercenaria mercenaria TaxID=6596 RepID=UPI001E1DBB0C|nr:protein PRQFV-amide-like [Mercenaria mercenaria]
MRISKALDTLFVIVFTTHCLAQFARCIALSNDNEDEKVDRTRRDISDFDEIKSEDEKRQREFIGKRSADDQPLDIEEMLPESDGYIYSDVDKRLREFIGKRSTPDFETEKRMRDFLGKRDLDLDEMEKRQREFVGKRSKYYDDDDEFDTYDKRMREFIGKRSYNDYSYLAKRLREFVGKRLTPEGYYRRLRQPRYQRELIGKRSSSSLNDNFNEDKRMREFIGKRMREFVGKRMRDFLG